MKTNRSPIPSCSVWGRLAACRLLLAGALSFLLIFNLTAATYKSALPGYHYEFPRDHFNHPDFQTEWWYYTGNLHTSDGRRFGFELTFFRLGVDRSPTPAAVWDVRDIWMAHLALSDIDGHRFFHTERLNRSGASLAGADLSQARVWNGNWQAVWQRPDFQAQTLTAIDEKFSFVLNVKSDKPPVIHGANGVSQKSQGEGHASHYISFTRLITNGTITLEGKQYPVTGLSWMDHEYFTEQLAPDQTGWDWFSLQFTDGSEVMLYRLRHEDGTADPYSAGTYIDPQGHSRNLTFKDFTATPGKEWISPATGTHYPIEWKIQIPSQAIDVSITTRLPQQELASKIKGNPSYWEGAIDITGTRQGQGYLEMTRSLHP